MKTKVKWGILSTAKIGTEKVIPAMRLGEYCDMVAISSRNIEKAKAAAKKLNIPKAYGSYDELIVDDEIEAVYIPVPNHLHLELSLKALEAGKHVLCEKPIGMNAKEAKLLLEAAKKHPDLKVMEAFMYRHHPQIIETKKLIDKGSIGEVKNINSVFTYYNVDPKNVRNQADIGGGGLLDIGCYCISIVRFMFDDEPKRVSGFIEFDPVMKIDRLASAVLEFEKGTATFTCSTQIPFQQKAVILGEKGEIEFSVPFTPAPDEGPKVILHTNDHIKDLHYKACNQYTLQGDLFSKAIMENTRVYTPLEDALANMKVIDAVFESARTGSSVDIHQ